jgi:hypothetical protein
MPDRIQLSRRKGWRLPPNAVKVDRTTKWGNPFVIGESIDRDSPLWPYLARVAPGLDGASGGNVLDRIPLTSVRLLNRELAVSAYSWWILEQPHLMLTMADELGGKDLACWCRPGTPCHADDLLSLVAELESPDA